MALLPDSPVPTKMYRNAVYHRITSKRSSKVSILIESSRSSNLFNPDDRCIKLQVRSTGTWQSPQSEL